MHWNWNEKKSVHEETRQEKWLWPYIINGIFFVYIILVQFEKAQHKDINRRIEDFFVFILQPDILPLWHYSVISIGSIKSPLCCFTVWNQFFLLHRR